ncbi:MAG: diguanylate cyclase, partial [Porticoccaceae bacterium]|nr:diguanylate cyclase [Porticoccaceae bacterium]
LTSQRLQSILKTSVRPYEDSEKFSDEIVTARNVYADYEKMVSRFYDGVRLDKTVNMVQVQESVEQIVDSVIRNPDACMLLARLKRKSDYSYNHAIGSSIWAASMGRQLGLPKKVIISLSSGALLMDAGKVQLSGRILNKTGQLIPEEIKLVQTHVAKGLRLLENSKGVDQVALQMVRDHHERFNGKGYPRGLKADEISVYGRIGGIIDTYDALINDKPYCQGIPPSDAIRVLYGVRNVDFQGELVEQFIQALGIYPAGSLVELTNGEVGVVMSEHRHSRLRPKLLVLLDPLKKPYPHGRELDLFQTHTDEKGIKLEIARALSPGSFGIQLSDIVV